MRSISILGFAAATACAALLASSPADAGWRRSHGVGAGVHVGRLHAGFNIGVARPRLGRHAWRDGYRHSYRGWRRRGALIGAGVGYGVVRSGYAYAEPSVGYVSAPATRSWSRSYLVPQTVETPVTRTELVPVTSYRAVQRTELVPTTVYRKVTQTCSCTTDGVTREVPCAGGYTTVGASHGRGVIYNRPGLFTSDP